MKRWITLLFCSVLMSSCNTPQSVDVVSTIKPIHMLASAIAGQHLQLVQLIPDGTSVHHYALKPSDMRQLQSARLVLQIDPELEQFLSKSLQKLPTSTRHLALAQLDGIQLHALNEQHTEHTESSHDAHIHTHSPSLNDLHIWLDPNNAIVMSRAIAAQLKKIDPKHSQDYAANLQQLINQIQAVDQTLQTQLAPIKHMPILVFHNAWQYFAAHYGIQGIHTVNSSAIKQLSLSKAQAMQTLVTEKKIKCLLDEDAEPAAILQRLAQKNSIKLRTLDVMGTHIALSATSYIELLKHTAEGFLACQP